MNLEGILKEIDLEILRLQQARQLLSNDSAPSPVKRGPGRPQSSTSTVTRKTRTMSAAGRARIAAAQKARWAKSKRAAKKASSPAAGKAAAKKGTKKVTGKKNRKATAAVATTPATAAA